MTSASVSLIIVSQKRPEHLSLLLQSLRHQTHNNFEVIVVANEQPSSFVNQVKFIPFTDANISTARNAGIAIASGNIIAFCDDDAIPDPPWLERLVSPFINDDVGATTGFTRGRNGITRQWGAMRFDLQGQDHPLEIDESQPYAVFDPAPDGPIKLIGTNMAFRKSVLVDIDGFDENFRFFLDETDAKLRLDFAGWKTAVVPHAQVHHHFAASDRRTENRIPADLFEIGASKAYFCKTHMKGDNSQALRDFTNEQLMRLTVLVEKYKLKRRDVTPLMESLGNGMTDGLQRHSVATRLMLQPSSFQLFKVMNSRHTVLFVGPRDTQWMNETTSKLVSEGTCVSVIQLLPSVRYFQVKFTNGYWLHRGGVMGRSVRNQPLIKFIGYHKRFARESDRIALLHQIDKIMINSAYGPKF